MSSVLRNHWNLLIGLGAGIALGACATVALQHLTSSLDNKLAKLVSTIEKLQEEVHLLHTKLQEVPMGIYEDQEKASKRKEEFAVVNESSVDDDEDDEEFLEAIDENEFSKVQRRSQARLDELQVRASERENAVADDPVVLFAHVDRLMEGTDEDKKQALEMLLRKEKEYSNEADFLWRFSKSNYQNAAIQQAMGFEDKRRELVFKSVDVIRQALVKGENIPQVHKWYAITLGSLGDFLGTQEKIKNGFTFKEHIERAIVLDPRDASNYYLLGRWCYGVYMLTWVERKLAATLFATPPTSTVDEALEHFVKADELSKQPWKENSLFVAKCYLEKREYSSAAAWLHKAHDIPAKSQDDKTAHKEVETLVAKYGRYAQ